MMCDSQIYGEVVSRKQKLQNQSPGMPNVLTKTGMHPLAQSPRYDAHTHHKGTLSELLSFFRYTLAPYVVCHESICTKAPLETRNHK